jgi:hypothetical protein
MITALRGNMITKLCKIWRCLRDDTEIRSGTSSKMLVDFYQVTRRHIPEAVIFVAKLLVRCTATDVQIA